jgi:hypothetical protein
MPVIKKLSSLSSIKRKTPTDRLPTGFLNDNSVTGEMIRDNVVESRHLSPVPLRLDYGAYSPTVTMSSNVADASVAANFKLLGSGNRSIAVHNLRDGQTISILVQGAVNNVISFTAYSNAGVTTLSSFFAAGQNGTMSSSFSLFTLMRIGGSSGAGSNFVVIGVMHGM